MSTSTRSRRSSWLSGLSRAMGLTVAESRYDKPEFRRFFRPELQPLEDRLAPAINVEITFTTNNMDDYLLPFNPELTAGNTIPTVVYYPIAGNAQLSVADIRASLAAGFDVIVTSSTLTLPNGTPANSQFMAATCAGNPGNITWNGFSEDAVLDFNDIIIGTRTLSLVMGSDSKSPPPPCIPANIFLNGNSLFERVIFDSNHDTNDNLNVILDTRRNAGGVFINSNLEHVGVDSRSGSTTLGLSRDQFGNPTGAEGDIFSDREDPVTFWGTLNVEGERLIDADHGVNALGQPSPTFNPDPSFGNPPFTDGDGRGARITKPPRVNPPDIPGAPMATLAYPDMFPVSQPGVQMPDITIMGNTEGVGANNTLTIDAGIDSRIYFHRGIGAADGIRGLKLNAGEIHFRDQANVELNNTNPGQPGILDFSGEIYFEEVERFGTDQNIDSPLQMTLRNGSTHFKAAIAQPKLTIAGGPSSTLLITDFILDFNRYSLPADPVLELEKSIGTPGPDNAVPLPPPAIVQDNLLIIDQGGILQGTSDKLLFQPSVFAEGGILVQNGGMIAPGGILPFGIPFDPVNYADFRISVFDPTANTAVVPPPVPVPTPGSLVSKLIFGNGGIYHVDYVRQNFSDRLVITGTPGNDPELVPTEPYAAVIMGPESRLVGQGETPNDGRTGIGSLPIQIMIVRAGQGIMKGKFAATDDDFTEPFDPQGPGDLDHSNSNINSLPPHQAGIFVFGSDAMEANYATFAGVGDVLNVTKFFRQGKSPRVVKGFTEDGDKYIIRLRGPGELFVSRNSNTGKVFGIAVRNATKKTRLIVRILSNNAAKTMTVDKIGVTGSGIGAIKAGRVNIDDYVAVQGLMRSLAIRDLLSGDIYGAGTSNQNTTIRGQLFADSDIFLGSTLKKLKVMEYQDTDSFGDIDHIIDAPRVGTIVATGSGARNLLGDFHVDLDLDTPNIKTNQIIRKVRVANDLGGTWDVVGKIGFKKRRRQKGVVAASATNFYLGVAPPLEVLQHPNGVTGIHLLNLGHAVNVGVDVNGTFTAGTGFINSFIATQVENTDIETNRLVKARIVGGVLPGLNGDVINSSFHVEGKNLNNTDPNAINDFFVLNEFRDSLLDVDRGNVFSVTVGRIIGSRVYVGYTPNTVTDTFENLGTFTQQDFILRNFKTTASAVVAGVFNENFAAFQNSEVAANTFGNITIGSVKRQNNDYDLDPITGIPTGPVNPVYFGLKTEDDDATTGRVLIGGPFNEAPPPKANGAPVFIPGVDWGAEKVFTPIGISTGLLVGPGPVTLPAGDLPQFSGQYEFQFYVQNLNEDHFDIPLDGDPIDFID